MRTWIPKPNHMQMMSQQHWQGAQMKCISILTTEGDPSTIPWWGWRFQRFPHLLR